MDVLSRDGLAYFWGKCKSAFARKSHAHAAGDITSGTFADERIPTTIARKAQVDEVGAKVPKMFFGSTVVNAKSGEALLWSPSQFASAFGRQFDKTRDYVGVMNADSGVNGGYGVSIATYWNSGNIWVGGSGINAGSIRINYLVILGE